MWVGFLPVHTHCRGKIRPDYVGCKSFAVLHAVFYSVFYSVFYAVFSVVSSAVLSAVLSAGIMVPQSLCITAMNTNLPDNNEIKIAFPGVSQWLSWTTWATCCKQTQPSRAVKKYFLKMYSPPAHRWLPHNVLTASTPFAPSQHIHYQHTVSSLTTCSLPAHRQLTDRTPSLPVHRHCQHTVNSLPAHRQHIGSLPAHRQLTASTSSAHRQNIVNSLPAHSQFTAST